MTIYDHLWQSMTMYWTIRQQWSTRAATRASSLFRPFEAASQSSPSQAPNGHTGCLHRRFRWNESLPTTRDGVPPEGHKRMLQATALRGFPTSTGKLSITNSYTDMTHMTQFCCHWTKAFLHLAYACVCGVSLLILFARTWYWVSHKEVKCLQKCCHGRNNAFNGVFSSSSTWHHKVSTFEVPQTAHGKPARWCLTGTETIKLKKTRTVCLDRNYVSKNLVWKEPKQQRIFISKRTHGNLLSFDVATVHAEIKCDEKKQLENQNQTFVAMQKSSII